MSSTSPQQQLLQAIGNLSDQQIPIVLQFISSLETEVNNYPTKPQTVLERMGGYPKFLLEGTGNLSDRDVRKKLIADKIQARHQARHHE
ncbi:MAG: hypothetical protein KA717_16100 [Woronichinia naegeliana WA131]|jgi:hypothetical protein|uniref:Uncharacterized protein n=1 Tax=Woronichinia naegeliana WA131 TaxID=2824559 RepID=A0A977PZZ1_9CYAN|nr:MAG: hypothetical protein KA717_16100 [Woronichinia naegeliana WA131]